MLMVPASKVLTPPTVVIRTRSKSFVDRFRRHAQRDVTTAGVTDPTAPRKVKLFDAILFNSKEPLYADVAFACPRMANPVVLLRAVKEFEMLLTEI